MDGTAHTVRPGRVGLVPPGATVRFRYRIPDLQAFNKVCRRELGASPRALRGETPAS